MSALTTLCHHSEEFNVNTFIRSLNIKPVRGKNQRYHVYSQLQHFANKQSHLMLDITLFYND